MAKKAKKTTKQTDAPKAKFVYQCPACTEDAIETSNKMLGVSVNCMNCAKLIELTSKDNYRKI